MLGVGTLAQTYLGGIPFIGTPTPPVTATKGYAKSSNSAANSSKASDA
jgi:hypothetical protein